MKKNLKKISITILIIIIILLLILTLLAKVLTSNDKDNNLKTNIIENNIEGNMEISKENITINQVIDRIENQEKSEIYEIIKEKDNTKIVEVKENMKFKVALAGMLKNDIPKLDEIDEIISEKKLNKTGIYVESNSRNKFIDLINKFTNCSYKIDEGGYLKLAKDSNSKENENDKKIIELMEARHLYIISFSRYCYILDEVTGSIVDFPFENMDPYQVYQYYEQGNQSIVFITTNKRNKLTEKDIFEELLTLTK